MLARSKIWALCRLAESSTPSPRGVECRLVVILVVGRRLDQVNWRSFPALVTLWWPFGARRSVFRQKPWRARRMPPASLSHGRPLLPAGRCEAAAFPQPQPGRRLFSPPSSPESCTVTSRTLGCRGMGFASCKAAAEGRASSAPSRTAVPDVPDVLWDIAAPPPKGVTPVLSPRQHQGAGCELPSWASLAMSCGKELSSVWRCFGGSVFTHCLQLDCSGDLVRYAFIRERHLAGVVARVCWQYRSEDQGIRAFQKHEFFTVVF